PLVVFDKFESVGGLKLPWPTRRQAARVGIVFLPFLLAHLVERFSPRLEGNFIDRKIRRQATPRNDGTAASPESLFSGPGAQRDPPVLVPGRGPQWRIALPGTPWTWRLTDRCG